MPNSPVRFRDEFPEDCPPLEASEIREPITVYRLSDRFPARAQDFRSTWQRRPGSEDLMGVRECRAKGLSVFTDLADARSALHEKGGGYVVALELSAGMGALQETPSRARRSHCTWWPAHGIDYDELQQQERDRLIRARRRR